MDLTDQQWQAIELTLPSDPVCPDGRGCPWSDSRTTLNGILWILRTGARWQDLPPQYGPYQTMHRRFQNWVHSKVLEQVLLAVAQDLKDRGGLDLRECFIDGTFVPAKKRGLGVGKTKRGKGSKLMAIADRHGLPVAICAESASPAEVKLVTQTLEQIYEERFRRCSCWPGRGRSLPHGHRRYLLVARFAKDGPA